MSSRTKIPAEAIVSFRSKFASRVLFNEPLGPFVAYKVGGPADILVFPRFEEELVWIGEKSKELAMPVTVIGTGTNLLVHDSGIRGITLSLLQGFKNIEIQEQPSSAERASQGETLIRVGGGVAKPDLLTWAMERGLKGLEFSAGVPGTIGGGIFMNAGTKYGCYGDILRMLRIFDFENGLKELNRNDVHFGYREQSALRKGIVTSCIFALSSGDKIAIESEVKRIIQERADKQPLDFPSCGSTFKNPPGLSAGRLIERAGLKGLTVGDAEISLKHANFILNKGNAKASDILTLIDIIKRRVKEHSGTDLECEVIILGGDNH